MKRLKTLIIAAAVLAVLVGVYFLITGVLVREDGTEDQTEAETVYPAPVVPDNLTGLKLTLRGEEGEEPRVLSFKLKDDATGWLWEDDPDVPLDNTFFAEIVSTLSAETTSVILEGATDEELASYGLSEPACVAEFSYSDGSSYKYSVGNYNAFNKRYYFSEASAPRKVYMVTSPIMTSLDAKIEDALLWDTTPGVTVAKVTSLAIESGGRKLVYTYYPNGKSSDYTDAFNWYLSVDGADEIRVGAEVADEINSLVTGLRFTGCVWFTGELPEEYGLASPAVMTLSYNRTDKVTDSSTGTEKEVSVPATYLLSVGSLGEDGYYVRTETSKLVYTLAESDTVAKLIAAEPQSILPLSVENLNYALVDKLEMSFAGKSLTVNLVHDTSGAEKTVYTDGEGKEISEELFTALTGAMDALSAQSFADRTPATVETLETLFTAVVSFNSEGIAAETLVISTYADGLCRASFAGRDDQLVSREAVGALLEAAAAIAG